MGDTKSIMATLYKIDKLIHALDKSEVDDVDKIDLNDLSSSNKADDISIESIKQMMSQFVKEREWEKYHTPRNLLLALVGEVGELSEIFQWKGECKRGLPSFSKTERIHLGEEMADILLYLARLADVCDVNLTQAVIDKMQKNKKKYPAEIKKKKKKPGEKKKKKKKKKKKS